MDLGQTGRGATHRVFVYQQTKAGLLHLFGVHSIWAIALVSCTVVALNWFGDGLWGLVTNYVTTNLWQTGLQISLFPLVIFVWRQSLISSLRQTSRLHIREDKDPAGCKVLIAFLSTPGQDEKMLESLTPEKGCILNQTFREQFKAGWRMSLEAVAYHNAKRTLERVVVLPSADDQKGLGTYKHYQSFKALIEQAADGKVFVHNALEANPRWRQGVDYESARTIEECLNDVYQWLRQEKYRDDETLIDITSGQKVGSGVASIISLEAGRQVQYVSTRDYSVRYYDITYEKND
ncbi:MAG: hypothetical protein L0338_19455 [Acidobacteria bacterium]|nr:hypothetical protein [Acidobacteriota bacterium]